MITRRQAMLSGLGATLALPFMGMGTSVSPEYQNFLGDNPQTSDVELIVGLDLRTNDTIVVNHPVL